MRLTQPRAWQCLAINQRFPSTAEQAERAHVGAFRVSCSSCLVFRDVVHLSTCDVEASLARGFQRKQRGLRK